MYELVGVVEVAVREGEASAAKNVRFAKPLSLWLRMRSQLLAITGMQ